MSSAESGTQSVVVERNIPHPPEKIWRALTQPHLITEWLMKGDDFRPLVGQRFNLSRQATPEIHISIDCEVLEVEANRTLSYTWTYADKDPAYHLESVVTFTLTPTAGGTLLRMEQSGFRPDQTQALFGARYGWDEFLGNLGKLLDADPAAA